METSIPKPSAIEIAGEDLFNYAIDREDIKWLMARLPAEATVRTSTVEYELQILKIISVGWAVSYYLENHPLKNPLMELFWKAVYEFAQSLSQTTELVIGQEIDYFQILKDRLDMYVAAMAQKPEATEPATVIGPAFARTCGSAQDLFAFMTGSKMFMAATSRVKQYLEAVDLS